MYFPYISSFMSKISFTLLLYVFISPSFEVNNIPSFDKFKIVSNSSIFKNNSLYLSFIPVSKLIISSEYLTRLDCISFESICNKFIISINVEISIYL